MKDRTNLSHPATVVSRSRLRDKAGLPHLVWDADFARQAQQVADKNLRNNVNHTDDSVLYPEGQFKRWQGENLSQNTKKACMRFVTNGNEWHVAARYWPAGDVNLATTDPQERGHSR